MNRTFSLVFFISLIVVGCTDPNLIGLEVQPESDNIIISSANFEEINSFTESVDSMPTSSVYSKNLVLGRINDPVFGLNEAAFFTQILLLENNIILGNNAEVDSVVLSYTYSGYYGNEQDFDSLQVNILDQDIYKDSIYYSNSFEINPQSAYWVDDFKFSTGINKFLKIYLNPDFGEEIIALGEQALIDNSTFLEQFRGISVSAHTSNSMLYLDPNGSNSFLKVYYHNSDSDSLSLDFELGGDAARVNLFNQKEDNSIIEDDSRIYIQSMAGYQAKISLGNIDSLKQVLADKVINKVELIFSLASNSQENYEANNRLYLIRVADNDGNQAPLLDLENGEANFGGWLDNNQYKFNITRYFAQLLQDDFFIKDLYLQPYNPLFDDGDKVNANRTILDKEIQFKIYYSAL
tara:strand:- start:1944 stop:3164 length:1221 start_codon:yes stop_codon:yes gene_type:complete